MNMTLSKPTRDALAERERLLAEADTAHRHHREMERRANEAEASTEALARRREEALKVAARTGQQADVGKIDTETAGLAREHSAAMAELVAAREAKSEAAKELVSLHASRFGSFAEAAEALTVDAEQKLDALRKGYEGAAAAWSAAAAEWSLLQKDWNSAKAFDAPELSNSVRVPALPPAARLFDLEPPRLPDVERVEEAEAA